MTNLKNSIIEDRLLDHIIINNMVNEDVESLMDATMVVDQFVRATFLNPGALIAQGLSKRLAYKAFITSKGSNIDVDRLSKRLNRVVIDNTDEVNKHLVLHHVDDVTFVTVRVPNLDKENLGQIDNLGLVLDAIKTCLNLKPDNIKIIYDQALGSDFYLPSPINRLLTNMIGSCHSKDGTFSGPIFEFKTGFKANLVEILAAIKLLKDRSGKLRKFPGKRGEDGKMHPHPVTNLEDLKAKFNEESGLKTPGIPAYVTGLVTGLLSELVKVTNSAFPGVWIHSLKARNSTKASDGCIAKMGWKPIVVSPHKILSIFTQKIVMKGTKESLAPKDPTSSKKEDSLDYRGYRAAVALTLPLIDTSKRLDSKIFTIDALSIEDVTTINHFKEGQSRVDAVDLAYSIYVAVKNEKNKTALPKHFSNAFGNLVSQFNEVQDFQDSRGNIYPRYKDIPEHVRSFLQKKFNKHIELAKRSASDMEDDPAQSGTENSDTTTDVPTEVQSEEVPLRPTRSQGSAKRPKK